MSDNLEKALLALVEAAEEVERYTQVSVLDLSCLRELYDDEDVYEVDVDADVRYVISRQRVVTEVINPRPTDEGPRLYWLSSAGYLFRCGCSDFPDCYRDAVRPCNLDNKGTPVSPNGRPL